MKKYFICIIFILRYLVVSSQAPNIQWQKCLGGSANEILGGYIQQTTDGGYILSGLTNSNNGNVSGNHSYNISFASDYWIVKTDALGVIQWQKCLGGIEYDFNSKIQQTSDGGYIVTGSSPSYDGDSLVNFGMDDYWIIKLSSIGIIEWEKKYGGINQDYSTWIQQTSDGGFIVSGYSNSINNGLINPLNQQISDAWILKIDSLGILEWQKSFGGILNDRANCIIQTTGSGYIFTGLKNNTSSSFSNGDLWVVKLNNSGDLIWEQTYGNTFLDEGFQIIQLDDSSYMIAGEYRNNIGYIDCWVIKLNSSGGVVWEKKYGGTKDDTAKCITKTLDGNYIIGASSQSNDGDVSGNHSTEFSTSDYWIFKINPQGDIIWQKSFGGQLDEYPRSIQETSDSGIIVCGWTDSNDGDVSGNHGGTDYWLVKLTTNLSNSSFSHEVIQLYPNPVKNNLFITTSNTINEMVIIYDELGKTFRKTIQNNTIDVSELESGIYFIEFQLEDNTKVSKKFIKN